VVLFWYLVAVTTRDQAVERHGPETTPAQSGGCSAAQGSKHHARSDSRSADPLP